MMNSFLRPIQRLLKQRDLKVSDRTIKGFLEDIDQAAPWFRVSGDVNLPCWDKLGRDLTEVKERGELRSGTLPLWRLIRYCLKEGKCVDILHEGRRVLSAHQDSMSESDNKEKGNLKEERPKSSKASSKLHTKVEKEKKTDQDLTLSDSAEDELESEEEEDLEEAAAAYEWERYCLENTEPPPYYPPKAKLKGISSVPVVSNAHFIKHIVWSRLATAFPVFEDPTTHNRHHEMLGYKQLKDLAEAVRTYGVSASFTDQENPIWIPERLTRFTSHEEPDPDTSDKPDSSSDQSRTRDAVLGSDQNVADPDATECWNGTWTSAVIVKVPTFVPILVKVDPKTFPIMTLLRERRDFGITAAIIAAIVLSAAGTITAAVAMTNQIQTAQTINTVVEQTSAVMETQHRINKHLMSSVVAANQRMDLIQTQVEELFGLIQIGCIAKLKHMCVTPLRYEDAGNESRRMASYLAGNWTRDAELLMSQQLLQIAALNETRVEPISLGDFTNWLSSAFSFFKEWVGVGIFGAICCFGVVLCLWFLCRLRARQVRDKVVIIQALEALKHGVSPQSLPGTLSSLLRHRTVSDSLKADKPDIGRQTPPSVPSSTAHLQFLLLLSPTADQQSPIPFLDD
ncbi:hypothetical protein STEG23_026135 [Scotinomys teguina]